MELSFASKARSAKFALKAFNKGEINYPLLKRDPGELGSFIVEEAGSFENWLNNQKYPVKWDWWAVKKLNEIERPEQKLTIEQLQQTFIRKQLDYDATHFFNRWW